MTSREARRAELTRTRNKRRLTQALFLDFILARHLFCRFGCSVGPKPHTLKRKMLTRIQCGECMDACIQVETHRGRDSLLKWVDGACALNKTTGRHNGKDCF